jgi:hypothetical protein
MLKTAIAFTAACSMAASPCLAADLAGFDEVGARRSGAGVGAYVSVPLGGPRSGRTQAGLRLTVSHDYRDATAQTAPVIRSEALDLRLIGDREPTLYMAGRPLTGEQARRNNLTGVGTLVTVVVIAAAVVGGIVIWNAIDDSGEE